MGCLVSTDQETANKTIGDKLNEEIIGEWEVRFNDDPWKLATLTRIDFERGTLYFGIKDVK